MTILRWFGVGGVVLLCLGAGAGSPGGDAPRADSPAAKADATFAKLDQYFYRSAVLDTDDVAAGFTASHGPVIVVENFDFTLFTADGRKESFHGPVRAFKELKAVGHIGPCLFYIGEPYWRKPEAARKKAALAALAGLRDRVRAAAADADKIDWSNPAWAGREDKVRARMVAALALAERSLGSWIDKGDFSRADYQAFVKAYMPTMEGGFLLAILGEATAKRGCLLKWKKELGPDWEKVHVIIQGSEGRTTAGLTRELHTSGVVLRTLMSESQFNSHVFVSPLGKGTTQGIRTLVEIVENHQMAEVGFKGVADGKRLYDALRMPTENLASPFMREVVQGWQKGETSLPDIDKWLGGK